mmetsp:Transcript_18690/g.48134  ORF Transcript_18690/g.48134 Transcript_18690/m.48134 type:complete len:255 (-) Transcript_18690:874-1638(-)
MSEAPRPESTETSLAGSAASVRKQCSIAGDGACPRPVKSWFSLRCVITVSCGMSVPSSPKQSTRRVAVRYARTSISTSSLRGRSSATLGARESAGGSPSASAAGMPDSARSVSAICTRFKSLTNSSTHDAVVFFETNWMSFCREKSESPRDWERARSMPSMMEVSEKGLTRIAPLSTREHPANSESTHIPPLRSLSRTLTYSNGSKFSPSRVAETIRMSTIDQTATRMFTSHSSGVTWIDETRRAASSFAPTST